MTPVSHYQFKCSSFLVKYHVSCHHQQYQHIHIHSCFELFFCWKKTATQIPRLGCTRSVAHLDDSRLGRWRCRRSPPRWAHGPGTSRSGVASATRLVLNGTCTCSKFSKQKFENSSKTCFFKNPCLLHLL